MHAGTVVAHLVGVQAQLLGAAGLALAARTDGLTEAAVTAARVEERSIVLTWAMRGTLHIVSAEDLDRFVPLLTEPHVGRSLRRLREEGAPPGDAERACELIERMLSRDGPLTRAEIGARLLRRGIRTDGQVIAHLVWLAAAQRGVCFGPDRGSERTFVLARDWIGAPKRRADHEEAVRELALRYVRSHAPATVDDFAAWSGLRLRDARTAWTAIAPKTWHPRTPFGVMTSPRGRLAEAPAGVVRALPDLDEYLLGWRNRGFAVPPEHRLDVNAGGGFVRPTVLRDGTVIATWRIDRTPSRVDLAVRSFNRTTAATRRAVLAEASRLKALLDSPVEVSFDGPRSRRR
jgi:Winged helix DNA-binding domain